MKFRNILFPVDFSERSQTIAPCVRAAARHDGASVTLVNFIDSMWYRTPEAPRIRDLSSSVPIDISEKCLTIFAENALAGIETKILVESGDPGCCIVELARTLEIDLIMMPTRGRGFFRAALLGSVTAKVLHDTGCPVWTAVHAEAPAYAASTAWRTVLCAIDATPDALRLIRYAGEIASAWGATVYLVHALPPSSVARKDSAFATIAGMQKEAGTNFNVCIDAGKVSAIVAAAAAHHKGDLVLTGRGALPHVGGRLGTHVYSIVRDAPCPVLSI